MQALIAILGVMTLIFFLQRLAGDPVLLLVPQNATQADIEAMRTALGFDRPLAVQYLEYLRGLLTFDLGRSYVQNVSVWTLIASRLPYTLMLAGGASGCRGAWHSAWGHHGRAPWKSGIKGHYGLCTCGPIHANILERDPDDHGLRGLARMAAAFRCA